MLQEEQVNQVLDQVRANLQAHGGDVELVAVSEDGVVSVRLQGACKGCPMAQQTLKMGIEAALKEQLPEVQSVEAVE
ncbi:MAG: NifU family protein [Armatimonadetes bacterium]|nr:NifU family protein [Armatimonadota bacterium]